MGKMENTSNTSYTVEMKYKIVANPHFQATQIWVEGFEICRIAPLARSRMHDDDRGDETAVS